MGLKNLEILEEKITKAVALVKELQAENQRLRQQNRELLEKTHQDQLTIQRLEQERETLLQFRTEAENFKHKEEKIRTIVEAMLSKLQSIDERS